MGDSTNGVKLGRRPFFTPTLSTPTLSLASPVERLDKRVSKEKAMLSSCCFPFDIPKSPIQAMEFLSRSWSPSSSDFFQILSTSSSSSSDRLLLTSGEEQVENEMKLDNNHEATKFSASTLNSNNNRICADRISAWLAKTTSSTSSHSRLHSWMKMGNLKTWFGGDLLKGSRQKRKETERLQTAEIQAALSVTQLAAAVAGMLGTTACFNQLDGNNKITTTNDSCWNMNLSQAMASAAALVATVCAETAESKGANRAHIASAMNMGLAIQKPSDMIVMTATAATCLRGAETLKFRAKTRRCSIEEQEMLARGTQLPILTPSGRIQLMVVSIYFKHDMLRLRLGKKYLQGAITRYKEYDISHIIEDKKEGACMITQETYDDISHIIEDKKEGACMITQETYGFYFFKLGTTGGAIYMLFDDEMQCLTWKSSISHILYKE